MKIIFATLIASVKAIIEYSEATTEQKFCPSNCLKKYKLKATSKLARRLVTVTRHAQALPSYLNCSND